MLKLLIIGDSHCKSDILSHLKQIVPDILIFCISVGGQIDEITQRYSDRYDAIVDFDPTAIIIHLGHNDLTFHHTHNKDPSTSKIVTVDTLEFTMDVVRNIPSTPLAISSVLPRTFTDSSLLSECDVQAYNRKAKRHGQRLVTEGKKIHTPIILNNRFGKRISRAEEHSNLYLPDGLHLNTEGLDALATSWIEGLAGPRSYTLV